MAWQDEYERKQCSLDEIFERFIRGNQSIFTSGLHGATAILQELYARIARGELFGINSYGNWLNGQFPFGELSVTPDQFRYHTYFAGPEERKGMAQGSGCVTHIPIHFSDIEPFFAALKPDVAIVQMTPPDEDGLCNIGPLGFVPRALEHASIVIAQINRRLPRVFGNAHKVPVCAVDGFYLHDEELEEVVACAPSKEERLVAAHIVDRVEDGSCIQLGIGGISQAIAQGLASKRHLGAFTEMYSDDLVELQMKGIIDNSCKNYMPGVTVAGYSTGARRLYDFVDDNPEVFYGSYDLVCNPYHIAKNDKLVSMNTAISIDLTGQVCAESIGPRQYSASGGQMDFVRGAKWSKGGQSYIAVTSVAFTRRGPVSKIVSTLAPGSAVTTLRNDLHYVVTEYGVADLRYADIPTRARRLIAIAHPDFRDQLSQEARELGFLY